MTQFEQQALEEDRRDRKFNKLDRWRAIQDTIAWADLQQSEPRNSRSSRLKEQKRKNTASSG